MALNVTELRGGTVFREDGFPWVVVKYAHTKMGRGSATIRVKVRNLKSGAVVEKTYTSGARVEEADVEKRTVQFLYANPDGSALCMDMTTYDQTEVPQLVVGDALSYLTEGASCALVFFEDEPIGLEIPNNVALKVTYAEPGVRGDTANAASIKVQVETGLEVMTPMFVKVGDTIKVDTRTGEYLERV